MAQQNSRFQFPGFRLMATQDTSTHEVEIGQIEVGGAVFVVYTLRNKQFDFLPFVVSKIMNAANVVLWDFQREGFIGVGLLAKAGEHVVIALVGRGREGRVERVIPLSALQSNSPSDLREVIRLKQEVAKFLRRDYLLTPTEVRVVEIDQAKKRQEAEAQAAEAARIAEEEREAKEAERRARVENILRREQVVGYTIDGRRRRGLPVLEAEWDSLPADTWVMIVDSFDDGLPGNVRASFQVVKARGQNPKKGFLAVVTSTPPTVTKKAEIPKPAGEALIEREGKLLAVLLYPSMDDIRAARAAGLNGGTLAAVNSRHPKTGKIEVYAVHSEKFETVGHFVPV